MLKIDKFASAYWLFTSITVETLSEDEEDAEATGEAVSISASSPYSGSSEFSPTPGGPFSALTPSMWPQDIMLKVVNPVRKIFCQVILCIVNRNVISP